MSSPHVVVGSTNAIKVRAVRSAAVALFGEDVEVEGVTVSSGVPDQPWGDVETRGGAATRARSALAAASGSTIAIGIEAGLVDHGHDVIESMSWVVAIGTGASRDVRGQSRSASYLLPVELVRAVREHALGPATRTLFPDQPAFSGTVGPLTSGLLDRESHYRAAVLLALIPFNPDNHHLSFRAGPG